MTVKDSSAKAVEIQPFSHKFGLFYLDEDDGNLQFGPYPQREVDGLLGLNGPGSRVTAEERVEFEEFVKEAQPGMVFSFKRWEASLVRVADGYLKPDVVLHPCDNERHVAACQCGFCNRKGHSYGVAIYDATGVDLDDEDQWGGLLANRDNRIDEVVYAPSEEDALRNARLFCKQRGYTVINDYSGI
jgi:hypothetical protein